MKVTYNVHFPSPVSLAVTATAWIPVFFLVPTELAQSLVLVALYVFCGVMDGRNPSTRSWPR